MNITDGMKDCIDACQHCHDLCKMTFFGHCLGEGGAHLEPHHVVVMADCVEICNVAASFMLRGSDRHGVICATCAEICDSCADSCSHMGTREMDICAEACRACATLCRAMSVDAFTAEQGAGGMQHMDHVM